MFRNVFSLQFLSLILLFATKYDGQVCFFIDWDDIQKSNICMHSAHHRCFHAYVRQLSVNGKPKMMIVSHSTTHLTHNYLFSWSQILIINNIITIINVNTIINEDLVVFCMSQQFSLYFNINLILQLYIICKFYHQRYLISL